MTNYIECNYCGIGQAAKVRITTTWFSRMNCACCGKELILRRENVRTRVQQLRYAIESDASKKGLLLSYWKTNSKFNKFITSTTYGLYPKGTKRPYRSSLCIYRVRFSGYPDKGKGPLCAEFRALTWLYKWLLVYYLKGKHDDR